MMAYCFVDNVPDKKKTITLELSYDEAITLADVLGAIKGYSNSRRKHTDSVRQALTDGGGRFVDFRTDFTGNITFTRKA